MLSQITLFAGRLADEERSPGPQSGIRPFHDIYIEAPTALDFSSPPIRPRDKDTPSRRDAAALAPGGGANGRRETGAVDGTRSNRSRTPYKGTDWADTIRQLPTP